ncbi:MAG: ribosome maturation factor RimP [Gammaproteobacteria bacterium]|nr:ribosome maturation factor RimP [Gammaproteobacteria bacterium]
MGLGPIFCFRARSGLFRVGRRGHAVTTPLRDRLIGLVEPLVEQLGYELVELEYVPGRSQALVRLFVDRPQGVGIEDCESVSREVSALLDVNDPVPTAYALEVSSPGLDRVLRKPAHFERFVGQRVWVELVAPREGRRRYTGTLTAASAAGIELNVDGVVVALPHAEIGRARRVPEWPQAARRKVKR